MNSVSLLKTWWSYYVVHVKVQIGNESLTRFPIGTFYHCLFISTLITTMDSDRRANMHLLWDLNIVEVVKRVVAHRMDRYPGSVPLTSCAIVRPVELYYPPQTRSFTLTPVRRRRGVAHRPRKYETQLVLINPDMRVCKRGETSEYERNGEGHWRMDSNV